MAHGQLFPVVALKSGDIVNTDTSKEQEAAEAVKELVREMKESASGTDKKLRSSCPCCDFCNKDRNLPQYCS